ncbi:ABC transporter substrate-binding protein [Pseudomonas aeruginosa]
MTQLNPFIRGYESFRIERNLQITDEGNNLPCYRALHETQQHLPDEYFQCELCYFNNDFAVVVQELDDDRVEKCPHQGIVRNVLYSIYGEQDGRKKLIGDQYSLTEAESVVRYLSFGGGYNRCWEIRKTHLPISAWNSLYERFSTKMPIRLPSVLVSLFWCNEHGAVGFRLHNTPWTDECLEILEMTAAALRQEQLAFGLDEHLVDLLHLAGQADIRLLVLDPFAPTLKGLPLYDD